jgi:uncharacterized integral membrane protein (TIGR00697 family)
MYSFAVMILWLLGTQLVLLFTPNANDTVHKPFYEFFRLVPRITVACLAGFLSSQTLDVFLYHMIWKKTGGSSKMLWLRNNVATLVSQAVDTVLFAVIAFWGSYPTPVLVSILLTTYLFKAIVALADTPFLYLARKIRPLKEDEHA